MPKSTPAPQQYRQGDCFLVRTTITPIGTLRPTVDGRFRLLLGEATGHHHSVPALKGVAVLDAPDGATFLTIDQLTGAVALEHQEHDTITLPHGTYQMVRQREWTDTQERRPVGD